MSKGNFDPEMHNFRDKLLGDIPPVPKYRKPRGHEDYEFIDYSRITKISSQERIDYSDGIGGLKPDKGLSIFDTLNKRRLAVLVVPAVIPPITKEDLRKLTEQTEEARKANELLNAAKVKSLPQPEPARFVALVDADVQFDAQRHDEWGIAGTDVLGKTTVGVGRTALFDVAMYSTQAETLQTRLEELASGRLPGEQ